MKQAASIQLALEEIERMPGIGPKSAQRILNWLLTSDDEVAQRLADAIVEVKSAIHLCPRCHNYAEGDLCTVCSDPERDTELLCVVAETSDLEAIERTGAFTGLYHVLGGVINPSDGVRPEDLHISDLMARLGTEHIEEVILATSPTLEGEATASYLAHFIMPMEIKVSRIAKGISENTEVEHADEVTLGYAIGSRVDYRSSSELLF